MENILLVEVKEIYTAENLDTNRFGEDYYSDSSYMTNKWECENLYQYP
ncbi:MAG: hypothetical protein NC120_12160 [Ruminococcus sp.]|nr:hypothetical protein [Ruminococcus sp.]